MTEADDDGLVAKVETTLTLEQLDAALELNGKLHAFDAGYAKGFAAGLEAGAEMAEEKAAHHNKFKDYYAAIAVSVLAEDLRERSKEDKERG